jgi:hypothetical protein
VSLNAPGGRLSESRMRENLTYGLMWQGMESWLLPWRHPLTLPKPHRHFRNVITTQASWKKATNILI